ncbi:hypothetical protein [Candidatus Chlorohelix sp.]|uniref:hypothetical protein n=1 Tax=Candidatus Chlorohelix sp. TaxID=3139201 RepID=UPI00305BF465
MKLLAITRDLMFMSKVKTSLQHLPPENGENWSGVFARNDADFRAWISKDHFELALVDTQASQFDWESLIKEACQAGIPTLAFGSHMQAESLLKARQAGAYKAVANSAIVQRFAELISARHKPSTNVAAESFEVEE